VFSVGLNRAVTLIAEKAAGGKGRFQRAKPTVLKDLGEHPEGGKIEVLSGRYGPYVKHDKTNATVPNGKDPAALTLEEAIELIAARAAKGGKKRPAKKAAAKKPEKSKPEKSAKAEKPAKAEKSAKAAAPAKAAAKPPKRGKARADAEVDS
jgi:DNA topoisomerase-1